MEFSLKSGLEKTGLPLLVTSKEPKGLCFLIDTSATRNTLFEDAYNYFKNKIFEYNTQGDGFYIILNFEGKDYCSIFHVLYYLPEAIRQVQDETGIQIHGILGMPFLNGWTVDFNRNVLTDSFYNIDLLRKRKTIINLLKSIKGIDNRKRENLSNINMKCIVDYTYLLLDEIHFKDNWELGLRLNKVQYWFNTLQYYLQDMSDLQNTDNNLLSKVIPKETSEFWWQIYFLTNAHKILEEDNEYIGDKSDLIYVYSQDFIDTIDWQSNVDDVISPKIFWNRNNYAKVKCCWHEDNYGDAQRGLYIDTCEYKVQNNTIQLVNRTEQQLITSTMEDYEKEHKNDTPLSDENCPF